MRALSRIAVASGGVTNGSVPIHRLVAAPLTVVILLLAAADAGITATAAAAAGAAGASFAQRYRCHHCCRRASRGTTPFSRTAILALVAIGPGAVSLVAQRRLLVRRAVHRTVLRVVVRSHAAAIPLVPADAVAHAAPVAQRGVKPRLALRLRSADLLAEELRAAGDEKRRMRKGRKRTRWITYDGVSGRWRG